jgi:hypothetical protein
MSLTSYRAAPPRDKPLRAFSDPKRSGDAWGAENRLEAPEKATPGECRWGASGMYQREPGLERANRVVLSIL